jgi:hypothetical protein
MKSFLRVAAVGSLCGLMVWGFEARAALEVSASVQIHAAADFEAPLTTCGTWVLASDRNSGRMAAVL